MTLEEVIMHCKEKACDNTQCTLEHRQLAEWLEELKELRFQKVMQRSVGDSFAMLLMIAPIMIVWNM